MLENFHFNNYSIIIYKSNKQEIILRMFKFYILIMLIYYKKSWLFFNSTYST